MTGSMLGYGGIVVLVLLLLSGMPLYLSMGITGFLGIMMLMGFNAALGNLASLTYDWGTKWTLVTIPLFVLMGHFLFHSRISQDLYEAAHKLVGHLPGGLAISTVAACTAFGACSASSLANAAAMGVIAVPEMRRYKYDIELATGTVAAGGTIGVMMPPSIGLIVLGTLTGQSIGKLFIAGILPALLMMAVYSATIVVQVKLDPNLALPVRAFSWSERGTSLLRVWPVITIFFLILGGMYAGVFTATEAGAVGCFASFLFLASKKRLTRQTVISSLTDTIRTCSMIFFLFIGAAIFSNFLALTRLPVDLAQSLISFNAPPDLMLWLILSLYIPLGCIIDLLSGWMLTVPIFYPVIEALGINPILFCILMQLFGELGLITPPVGLNVFVINAVTDVPLERIFRGIVPFVVADLITAVILWAAPPISLWLPSLMR